MAKTKGYYPQFNKIWWLKRKRRPLQSSKLKHCKRMALEDRLIDLPDEILSHILSLLTFKEAVATSILSRRWQYLWTNINISDCNLRSHTSSLNICNGFNSITELFLGNVTDELFKIILLSCSSLTHLHLSDSHNLINANHPIPHPKLKCLEIYLCRNLENLEISAPNLVSFKYKGSKIYICIKDARQLVNVSIISSTGVNEYPLESALGFPYGYPQRKDFVFGQFAAYLSQMEYLMLDVSSAFKGKWGFSEGPVFSNLKTLSLVRDDFNRLPVCYLAAACLIKASPLLHRLELDLNRYWQEGCCAGWF